MGARAMGTTAEGRCSDGSLQPATLRLPEQEFKLLGLTDPLPPFGQCGFRTRCIHLLSAIGAPRVNAACSTLLAVRPSLSPPFVLRSPC